MTGTGQSSRRRWVESLVTALSAVILLAGTQSGEVAVSGNMAKLTTALAELARSVPQEQGPVSATVSPSRRLLKMEALSKPARDAIQTHRLRINASAEVQVYVLMSVTDQNLNQLKAEGVTIEIADAVHRRVQARIPVSRLELVAALPFINFIRLPTYAHRMTGSVDTEGDAIMHSDQVRSLLKVDGTGVNVGVISDGIKGVFAACPTAGVACTVSGVTGGPISTGDLPAATGSRDASGILFASTGGIEAQTFPAATGDLEGIVPGCGFAGAGAEGTALLEIVHDIAPGATLSFANANTDLDFEAAVNSLAANNDIVMDDFGFFGEAEDGSSPVSTNTAAALNNPTNQIRAYVTSGGNAADEHYYGTYTDSGVSGNTITGITNSGDLHLFQAAADGSTVDVLSLGPKPYNLITLPPSGEVVIFLTWDDRFGASANNYDLYLVQESTGQAVAASTDAQNGTQDPLEAIDYVNNTGAQNNFHIVIQNVGNAAAPKNLDLFSFEPECATAGPLRVLSTRHERQNYNTATRSVTAESDAGGSPVSVISAGAICSASSKAQATFSSSTAPDESCLDTTNSTIEFFSGQGPTLDGRNKPDISGIDGVSVTGAGSFENPFFGTSAAAPHVAAVAALALEGAPCLLSGTTGARDAVTARTNLRNLLLDSADPVGSASPASPNNIFGTGRADALAAVTQTLPTFGGGATVTVSGNSPSGATLTGTQLGFSDPNLCPLTTLSWSGGCGTGPATSMSCPFGSTSLNVMASNNGVSFSSPAAAIQVVVTNFSVGVSPGSQTVTAGNSATYTVNVSSLGGAFTNNISLACSGLPSGAACSFNPSTVTPGATSATSTLTVTTTGAAAAPANPALPNALRRWLQWPFFPASWSSSQVLLWIIFLAIAAFSSLVAAAARKSPRRSAFTGTGGTPVLRTTGILPVVFAIATLALGFVSLQIACGGGGGNGGGGGVTLTPAVTLSPASLAFAVESIGGTSAAQTVTLSNPGNAALGITGISASGDFAETNTCGASVAAGANCAINVTFKPSASGARTGTISITDNAGGSPQTVSLTGTGQAPTPAGTTVFNLTGTSGSLSQSATATLVVN